MDEFLDYTIAAINMGGRAYLLTNDKGKTGRVLDLDTMKLFPPFNFESIVSRGYWQVYRGTETVKDIWVDGIEIVPIPEDPGK